MGNARLRSVIPSCYRKIDMKDINVEKTVDSAISKGASYADVRFEERSSEVSRVWDGKIEELLNNRSIGYGVRVLVDGAWGFAGSNNLEQSEETVRKAIAIARASAKAQKKPVRLAPVPIVRDHYRTPVEIDPHSVSLSERVGLMFEADAAMAEVAGITQRRTSLGIYYTDSLFASSEGAYIEQNLVACGGGTVALASDGNDTQFRSFPASFQGDHGTGGYERILGLNLIEGSRRFAEQAVRLVKAKPCKSGTKTIVLNDSLLTLMVHESLGHALELDRVLGSEAAYAGTSFITTDKLNREYIGSEHVTITADSTLPGGLASCGYDDEGVPAKRTVLIDKGLLVNYLSSRETSYELDLPVTSCTRADGWNHSPLIRMTNVSLEPGDSSLEQMISEIDDGLYMETVKTYSIDDKRLNFQFAPEIAWEIKHGKITDMVKNVRYSGMTPEFWNACDAVAGPAEWHLWGIPVCGKGEPCQSVMVGHGTAPARFRDIQVLGA